MTTKEVEDQHPDRAFSGRLYARIEGGRAFATNVLKVETLLEHLLQMPNAFRTFFLQILEGERRAIVS